MPKIDQPTLKKKSYFGEVQEEAIKKYLTSSSELEKNELFQKVISTCLKKLVKGVLSMPMFSTIGKTIPIDILEEETYYHILFQITRFDPTKTGVDGKPVKAYSYLGTCAKHFIIAEKQKIDKKIAKHGGQLNIDDFDDVITSEETDELSKLNLLLKELSAKIDLMLENNKLSETDRIVGLTLKRMFLNWHKIDFMSKNEFIRQLTYQCGIDSVLVAKSFKKFKLNIYEKQSKSKPHKIKKLGKDIEIKHLDNNYGNKFM